MQVGLVAKLVSFSVVFHLRLGIWHDGILQEEGCVQLQEELVVQAGSAGTCRSDCARHVANFLAKQANAIDGCRSSIQ
jgi:hypothetical protein